MSEHVIWETKGRGKVRILWVDRPGERPIVGCFIENNKLCAWGVDGRLFSGLSSDADLIIPEGAVIGETNG